MIQLEFTGVASHNSMDKIEQAHAPLRRVYRILSKDHPKLSAAMRLRYAVKALNDSHGERGLVPSMSVFGVISSLENSRANLCGQDERFNALKRAREEAATNGRKSDQQSAECKRSARRGIYAKDWTNRDRI